MYTSIVANNDQINQLVKKHIKPFFCIKKIYSSSYSYDEEDKIGFVKLLTITGKEITYQFFGDQPMFVEFTGFGSIRYDVHYPNKYPELNELLIKYGIKAKYKFWKGDLI